ncbi:hypothetical protein LB505_008093 [Fusarium chuoi]|nr:hypothetical protein LB505_008093 [Fusarium chuoi]
MIISLFISRDRLIDCCREIYFAVDNFSLPTFLIANATLRYLFQEKAQASQDPLFREEYRRLSQLCRDNLETAMNKPSTPSRCRNQCSLGSSYLAQQELVRLLVGINLFLTAIAPSTERSPSSGSLTSSIRVSHCASDDQL